MRPERVNKWPNSMKDIYDDDDDDDNNNNTKNSHKNSVGKPEIKRRPERRGKDDTVILKWILKYVGG